MAERQGRGRQAVGRGRGQAGSGTGTGLWIAVLVVALAVAVLLPACKTPPPEITEFKVSPVLEQAGSFNVLDASATFTVKAKYAVRVEFYWAPTGTGQEGQLMHTDTTSGDGFTWTWTVPEFTMAHVWAKAYNKKSESVQSDLMGVYREAASQGG